MGFFAVLRTSASVLSACIVLHEFASPSGPRHDTNLIFECHVQVVKDSFAELSTLSLVLLHSREGGSDFGIS